jgi:hypothetical protein
VLLALLRVLPAAAAAVPVRFAEGSLHGFLVVRSSNGETLAYGEQVQVARNEDINSRLFFNFKDGSVYDETVVFSQRKEFTLKNYRLTQRGASFPKPLETLIDRATSHYKVRYREESGSPEEIDQGRIDLLPDVYNGMLSVLLKNLPKGAKETVHVVVFTPKPVTIKIDLTAAGEDFYTLGEIRKRARRYSLKPQLGALGLLASLVGKQLPEYQYWMSDGDAPGFVAFEGPFFIEGPVWRVELTSPQWPRKNHR